MTVIGITGPSGAGKGALSKVLNEKYGFPVIDADNVYHSLVSSPSDCLDEIKANFGEKVINESGALDRRVLGKLVLGEENRSKLELLNQITHKYVVDEIKKAVETYRSFNLIACIIDAPLLIEAGLCEECDLTLSVLANKEKRVERISLRDSISIFDAEKRIESQKDDVFYIQNTDYTLNNDSDIDSLLSSAIRILSERRVI